MSLIKIFCEFFSRACKLLFGLVQSMDTPAQRACVEKKIKNCEDCLLNLYIVKWFFFGVHLDFFSLKYSNLKSRDKIANILNFKQ